MLPGIFALERHARNRMLQKDGNNKEMEKRQEVRNWGSIGVTVLQTEITSKLKCRDD